MRQDYAVDDTRVTAAPTAPGRFDPNGLERLPEPAQRWLAHSIEPGTPLFSTVTLVMDGEIKLSRRWHRFTARQVVEPGAGYLWSARTHVAGLKVDCSDRMLPASARLRWDAAGVPMVRSSGPDLLNTAAGRLAAESLFVPTAFGVASWQQAADPDEAIATWRVGARVDRARIRIAADGALVSVALRRWGRPPGTVYGRYPYGLGFGAEQRFGPITIPGSFQAHWWWDTELAASGEFLRARILSAEFA
jgi:hypothetical protein